MSMQSKELVYRALNFEMVPKTPYAIDFTVPALQRLRSSRSGNDIYQRLANDIYVTPVIRVEWGQRNALGRYRDEFGLEWDRSIHLDIGIPQYFVTPENLRSYPMA